MGTLEKVQAREFVKQPKIMVDLNIIAQIESDGNPKAFNQSSGAVGMYQITPIALKDYNNMTGSSLRIDDMYDPKKAEKVAGWMFNKRIPQMLRAFRKPVNLENVLTAYNWGIANVGKELVPETANYIKEYRGRKIQGALEAQGFPVGRIDGKIGPKTTQAIRGFQKAKGLTVDGIAGEKTRKALGL